MLLRGGGLAIIRWVDQNSTQVVSSKVPLTEIIL
jgi:hypothetical protein